MKASGNTQTQFSELHALLGAVLDGTCTPAQASALINLCHKFALAYLRASGMRGGFEAQAVGISLDQLAFDAIADLFARDAEGSFHQLRQYFARLGSFSDLSEDQVVSALRRLIFSVVKNHRYRTFQQTSPSLARISRNLKLALKKHPLLRLTRQHGMPAVSLRAQPKGREGLPELPQEFLIAEFFAGRHCETSLRKILDTLAGILQEQELYAGSVLLAQVCELVQTALGRTKHAEAPPACDEPIAEWEIRSLINHVVHTLDAGPIAGYVRKGKLASNTAQSYGSALAEILELTFCSNDGDESSYYTVIQKHVRGLGRKAYIDNHRPMFEYLAKTAKAAMREKLRAEFGFPRKGHPATREERRGTRG
jgi:hypothetical protein